MNVYLWFQVSPQKKITWVQIRWSAGQPMSPRNEIKWLGNISLKIPIAHREVWAVSPSCWNQTLSLSSSSFNLGLRKVSSIAQYRSEFTVTVNSEVHTECPLCCSYQFVVLDKRFHNESAMLTCSVHIGTWKWNETKWHYMYISKINTHFSFFTLFRFY